MMKKIPPSISNYILYLKCGFGIGQKYRPIWVTVSDLNQNRGFGHTLSMSQKGVRVFCKLCEQYFHGTNCQLIISREKRLDSRHIYKAIYSTYEQVFHDTNWQLIISRKKARYLDILTRIFH